MKERHYQLPSTPTRAHSMILLIFFTLLFVCENAALINLDSDSWWFALKDKTDKYELGFFVTRYVCTLLLFVLGISAPGIRRSDEDEAPLFEELTQENDVR